MNDEQFLWVERYRPHKISDCILPESLKQQFQNYVNSGNVPNLILAGGAGMGKTTIAKALCDELGLDHIMINGSNERNIETLRVKIVGYASSVSLAGGRKVIIIDEADYLNKDSTQLALRAVMEEFADNCSFVFTCNHKNRILEPIHSRCAVIDFHIQDSDKQKMAGQFFKRVVTILTENKIEFDRAAVIDLIKRFFPDFRRCLNELQRYAVGGIIDAGIFKSLNSITDGIEMLRSKEFSKLQSWVVEQDVSAEDFIFSLYKDIKKVVKPEFIPAAIVLLGKYQFQSAFVADKQLNLMAMFSEMMMELEMKE